MQEGESYGGWTLIVQQCDRLWEETVPVSGCSDTQCTVASPRGEKFKEIVSRVGGVSSDVACPFPGPGPVQVLDGRQASTNNFLC